ncbi:hypothetical protein PG985_011078 [Apiospora marii]|uniref:Uncharacterized protein n=1 Tax=Apiospora marii TaxID=335849 RepID=A0ABR1SSN9_9PEZI
MRLHLATASLLLGLAISAGIPPLPPVRGHPDPQPVNGGGLKPAPVRPPPTGGEQAVEATKAVQEIVNTTYDLVQSIFPAQDNVNCRATISAINNDVDFCNRALSKQNDQYRDARFSYAG